MSSFQTVAVIDWSAANDRGPRPRADAVWSAVARAGRAEAPRYHRNRRIAEDWLAGLIEAELGAGRRLFAGFDFPFGYPEGFAEKVVGGADPLVLWNWFADHLEDRPERNDRFSLAARLNGLFPGTGPYWFNGLKADIPGLPRRKAGWGGHGLAERRLAERRAAGAFTLWQMGGAGAVGGQAMTGMAALARLRRRFPGRIAVWPFEPLDRAVALIEVWPSLYAAEVAADRREDEVKDAAQVRFLAEKISRMDEAALAAALAAPQEARAEEGWIFGLGAAPEIAAARVAPGARGAC